MSDDEYPESNATKSEFRDFYKYSNRDMSFTLEKKRQMFLKQQKEKRTEAFDEKRDLSQLFEAEPMELEASHKPKHKKNPFGYKLMGSEWFLEVPEDFKENWLIKLCPEGVRFLVVAHKGVTTCYYRNGRPNMKFRSKLPGGNPDCANRFTVLDCIYDKTANSIFIYDVLAWNSVSLLNAEASMRFFWLKNKFEEDPEMCEINKSKNFNFVLIDFLPGEVSLLQDYLFTPFMVPFDGILFYHKEGHYVFKQSPLVGWLKLFMVPEVLNIDVPSYSQKPEDYESVGQYLSKKKKKDLMEVEVEEEKMLD